jgi:hypothetical protein
MAPSTTLPLAFSRAVSELEAARPRAEIRLEEIPAPQRLAPFAYAVGATVVRGDDDVATGRLVLLHDPAGHEAWDGTLRLVTYVTADIEPELGADVFMPTVAWTWLIEALQASGARYKAIGGTITQTSSTKFGELSAQPMSADIEIRASWTPVDDDLTAHMYGWFALMASTAGLPPPGVAAIGLRR